MQRFGESQTLKTNFFRSLFSPGGIGGPAARYPPPATIFLALGVQLSAISQTGRFHVPAEDRRPTAEGRRELSAFSFQ
jgi:hypothetical protein